MCVQKGGVIVAGKERLNVNLASELKKKTAKILEASGLDFTTAINSYFRQIVNKQKIPFELSTMKYFSTEDVMGENWREGLEDVKDEWE